MPAGPVRAGFSQPGNPTDNNFIQSFNGKFGTECLNTHTLVHEP
ncbi:transposase [Bradyrhizobium sp. CW4]|nr:transposase [Bradyrhizobium sp. CW4]